MKNTFSTLIYSVEITHLSKTKTKLYNNAFAYYAIINARSRYLYNNVIIIINCDRVFPAILKVSQYIFVNICKKCCEGRYIPLVPGLTDSPLDNVRHCVSLQDDAQSPRWLSTSENHPPFAFRCRGTNGETIKPSTIVRHRRIDMKKKT